MEGLGLVLAPLTRLERWCASAWRTVSREMRPRRGPIPVESTPRHSESNAVSARAHASRPLSAHVHTRAGDSAHIQACPRR